MHYLPLLMNSNTADDSVKSPFYYAFDGKKLGVCFCTDKDFALEQVENSRAQHFDESFLNRADGYWGLGVIEFGTINQIVSFIKRWNVLVDTKIGKLAPSALVLWVEGESQRFITFADIAKAEEL